MERLRIIKIGKEQDLKPSEFDTSKIPPAKSWGDGAVRMSLYDMTHSRHRLKNCISRSWTEGYYYMHPRRQGYFIPAEMFQKYIVEDQLRDISEYVTEHFALKSLCFGLVKNITKAGSADVGYIVHSAGADLKVTFDSKFQINMKNIPLNTPAKKHCWINDFPMIKFAVQSKASEFEKIEEINNSFSANGKIIVAGVNIKGKYVSGEKVCFYMKYKKA